MNKARNAMKANLTNVELLSYIMNQNPELVSEIGLPKQGSDLQRIGEIIVNNERYRNKFLNTINLIGLTVIKRNNWQDLWDFTEKGILRFGQTVREIIVDLAPVFDYNENYDNKLRFTETIVPDVYQYLHELNFQKFYQMTTNDDLTSMTFVNENGLFDLIEKTVEMLYQSYIYDNFLINKYQLARRIVDGTVTTEYLNTFATDTNRQRVSSMKNISNRVSFRSPNFNPAGVRRATSFADQILILSSRFEADFSTDVLATSYFKDEADYKARCVLIDTFAMTDVPRLAELLGNQYIPFTESEIQKLDNIPAVLISEDWFMNYMYGIGQNGDGMRANQFYNVTTHDNNHFLSVWKVYSTSPYANACVFTLEQGSVTSVTISPQSLKADPTFSNTFQYTANVVTTGFVNKSVLWTLEVVTGFPNFDSSKIYISQDGVLHYTNYDTDGGILKITATSIYDNTKSASVEADFSS